MNISDYIESLQAQGRYTFATKEAEQTLIISKVALKSALHRMRQKRVLTDPVRGFQLILPPEYRKMGVMPPEYFIDELMHYLKAPYYVGLLSAAQFHGAGHQQPQQFQVVTNKSRSDIRCGQAHIVFVARKNIENIPTQIINTPYGTVRVSTPETTAMDLVTYPYRAVGIDHVATLLVELEEKIKSERLFALTQIVKEVTWKQRLGYLLDFLGKESLAAVLEKYLKEHRFQPCALEPGSSTNEKPFNKKWGIIVNVDLEIDL